MTGRRNKCSPPQSRRSERVKNKWQRSASEQILGVRTEVNRRKRCHVFTGYPKLSSPTHGDLEGLLETAGLRQFYARLHWECPSHNHVQDFFANSTIVKRRNESGIMYHPFQCQFPIVITREKLARAFNLSLEGLSEPPDKATIIDVKTETRFKLHSADRYFSLASAETPSLFVAGKLANQALFLQQSGCNLSLHHMTLFRAALNGKAVAWGQVLWRNLVKRISSLRPQASGSGSKRSMSQKVASIPYAAVVVALLLRVDHAPEHEDWFQSLRSSQPKGSLPDSDESDDEFLVDLVANTRRKKAKLIKEEAVTDEDPLGFAVCDSALVAEEVHSQMMAGRDDLEKDDGLDQVSSDLRRNLLKVMDVQGTISASNLVDIYEEGDEEVSIGESETDDTAPDKTEMRLECARNYHIQANTSDITTERGNSAGCCENPLNDSSPVFEPQPVNVHQVSSSANAPLSTKRFDVQTEWPEDDVDLAVGMDDEFPEANEALSHSKTVSSGNYSATAPHSSKLFSVQTEWLEDDVELAVGMDNEFPEENEALSHSKTEMEGACAVDLMEDALAVTREDHHNVEVVKDANRLTVLTLDPSNAQLTTEITLKVMEAERNEKNLQTEFVNNKGEDKPEGRMIKLTPVSPRVALGASRRSVTEIAQVPASTLVKMAHIVKHFKHGLDEAGVPLNVYLRLMAGELLDALKFELENRGLQEFSEQTEFFDMNWSMDKIFEAHWSLQDRLRKSQIECLKLKEEVDAIFSMLSRNKQFVVKPIKPTNLIEEMFGITDQVAEGELTMPLSDGLKLLKDKMKDVKYSIKMMEVVQQRHTNEWLKQRKVLVQRWKDAKCEYSHQDNVIKGLEGKVKRLEDTLEEYGSKLQRESVQRSCHEVSIANLRDEIQCLKGAMTERTNELLHALEEKAEGLQAAMLAKEELDKCVEEVQRKEMNLINALTQIDQLKQAAETLSDLLNAQNVILNDKNEEISVLKEETARWMAESSACNLKKETLSKERRRAELHRLNQMMITQQMEETKKVLRDNLDISKDRIRKSDQLLQLKDQEINLLKVQADTAEKKWQDCMRTKEMALDVMQKHRGMQDAGKRQVASLKDEREKIESQLQKVLKRESRLIKELEEEKARLEEALLNQEEQDIWSIEEVTEIQTVADMRSQLAMLRLERKELFETASERLGKIVESYKLAVRSDGERSSASSAG